jgi:Sugar-tranasporters, 12 TM
VINATAMNLFYVVTFAVLAACTALLEYRKAQGGAKPYASNKGFLSFRNNYIFVYSLMMGALCLNLSCLMRATLASSRCSSQA